MLNSPRFGHNCCIRGPEAQAVASNLLFLSIPPAPFMWVCGLFGQ